jgi:hypothetical protein
MAETSVEYLQSVLAARHDRLVALPDVVGWGVGLGADGDPIVQVFVSAPPSDYLASELGRLFDRFEILVEARLPEAQ